MPKKILKAPFPEKCIGCELCVMTAQRLRGKVGLEGAPIKILGGEKGNSIHLDPSVNELDVKEIAEICPGRCYVIEEGQEEGLSFAIEDEK